MYKGFRVCVVVPARNEEQAIAGVLTTIPEFVDHIILVDDGSVDRTFKIASAVRDNRLRVIRHRISQGVGGAIIAGHMAALELADVSVVMAGDGQMDPEFLSSLLEPLVIEKYDFVKGNRFLCRRFSAGMPSIRVIGNRILSLMMKLATGYWDVSDPQNGYTAAWASTLKKLQLGKISRGYLFENDMLLNLAIAGFRVKDVSIPARYPVKHTQMRTSQFGIAAISFLLRALIRRWILHG